MGIDTESALDTLIIESMKEAVIVDTETKKYTEEQEVCDEGSESLEVWSADVIIADVIPYEIKFSQKQVVQDAAEKGLPKTRLNKLKYLMKKYTTVWLKSLVLAI